MGKIVIIGGKLQGVESAYLAKKAGLFSIVVDRRNDVPAKGLCDQFLCIDICAQDIDKPDPILLEHLMSADLVLPAMENDEVLETLLKLEKLYQFNLAFDFAAYKVSSSKIQSDRLFNDYKIPTPLYFPNCNGPYIAKPSTASGSEGVKYLKSYQEVEELLGEINKEEWVIQEFLEGKSYSIEVIGEPGNYYTYAITEIHMDPKYDCKKVTTPCQIPDNLKIEFTNNAIRIAKLLSLKGIMDVEVIEHDEKMKVLEIDARIPSQTPAAIYHSTGINLLSELYNIFCKSTFSQNSSDKGGKSLKTLVCNYKKKPYYSCYEQFLIENGQLTEQGEHIIGECGPITLYSGMFGSDEVLTDYKEGNKTFRGIFINSAPSKRELDEKRLVIRKNLQLLAATCL